MMTSVFRLALLSAENLFNGAMQMMEIHIYTGEKMNWQTFPSIFTAPFLSPVYRHFCEKLNSLKGNETDAT